MTQAEKEIQSSIDKPLLPDNLAYSHAVILQRLLSVHGDTRGEATGMTESKQIILLNVSSQFRCTSGILWAIGGSLKE